MTANRLPPSKHTISGCDNCPLLSVYVDDGDEVRKCQHPEEYERDVTGEKGVPDFCPLLRAPLLITIAKPSTEAQA